MLGRDVCQVVAQREPSGLGLVAEQLGEVRRKAGREQLALALVRASSWASRSCHDQSLHRSVTVTSDWRRRVGSKPVPANDNPGSTRLRSPLVDARLANSASRSSTTSRSGTTQVIVEVLPVPVVGAGRVTGAMTNSPLTRGAEERWLMSRRRTPRFRDAFEVFPCPGPRAATHSGAEGASVAGNRQRPRARGWPPSGTAPPGAPRGWAPPGQELGGVAGGKQPLRRVPSAATTCRTLGQSSSNSQRAVARADRAVGQPSVGADDAPTSAQRRVHSGPVRVRPRRRSSQLVLTTGCPGRHPHLRPRHSRRRDRQRG